MFRHRKLPQEEASLLQIYRDWSNNAISQSHAMEKVRCIFDNKNKYCFSYPKRFMEDNIKVIQSEDGKRYYNLHISYLEIQEQWDLTRSEVETLECIEVFLYGESITRYCPLMKNNKAKQSFEILLTKPFLGVFEFYFKEKVKVDTV